MPESADIVVIGGGVMGVSIAHHLAVAGAGSVRVLEKSFIGAGSSGRSGAIIRQHYSTRLLVEMARHGVLAFRDFARHTALESGWENVGCLFVVEESHREAAAGNVRLMQEAGADADLLTGDALRETAPGAAFEGDESGAWEPEAGYVDPALVLHGYADSARRRGARIYEGVEVLEVGVNNGRAAYVMTSQGVIHTRAVVLCAGPWAGKLAKRAGMEIPLTVVRPQVSFHRRPGDFEDPHPVIGDLAHGFYCRPDSGGRTLVGALDISGDQIIDNPDQYESGASGEFCDWSRRQIVKRYPAMARSFGRGGYSGLYTVTPDSHPIIGEAPGIQGLYVAVGFSGHGFKLSPAVGRGLAELITTGRYQSLDLSPLRPTRYAENEPVRAAYEYGLLS
jgi:sarcosine oxidase subunit beta